MAQVLVNDASLTAIAGAIRGKLDVETTYLPSQMAGAIESIPTGGTDLTSADEGKVVVEDAGSYVLAAQTSRSISQNGTYDTTTNDEVVVNVSGGEGGGGGGGVSPTFLTNSNQSDILANEYYTSYDEDNDTWGDVTVYGSTTPSYDGLHVGSSSGFDVQLGGANTSVTAYAIVGLNGTVSGNTAMLVSIPYSASSGNAPNINFNDYNNSKRIKRSNWGTDQDAGTFNYGDYHILAIAVDASNNIAYYYLDGEAAGSLAYTNSGSVVEFNGAVQHANYGGNATYLYVGVVDGYEDSQTVIANQQEMSAFIDRMRYLEP